MESIPRNVILDLLPVYIAGEASNETKLLIEEYAKSDSQIAGIIQSGKFETDSLSSKINLPVDLEMKTIKKVRSSVRRQMAYVAIATASILMIPFLAMKFTNEVNWSLLDFTVMGVLLFGTGLTYVFISRASGSILYRAAAGIAVLTGLFLIWVNLAVGIIGEEKNPANKLYIGVLAAGFIGAYMSRLRAHGMSYTMYAAAFIQILVPFIAFFLWRPTLDEPPGIAGVFMLNAFFAALFVLSGLFFKSASRKKK